MNKTNLVHLLVNDYAGSGQATAAFEEVCKYLTAQNIAFDIHKSNYPSHLIDLGAVTANKIKNNPAERLIVIGGDGSLNQVVNGVKKSEFPDTPIGYIPSGSGNDFARALKMPKDTLDNLKIILESEKESTFDLGHYHELNKNSQSYFVNNVGIGFDANVVSQTNNSTGKKWLGKLHLGNLSYGFNIINVLAHQKSFDITISADYRRQEFYKAYIVTTTNHPYFGGGIPILPRATVTNDKLDLVVVEKPPLIMFIILFIKMMTNGSHIHSKYFHFFEAKNISVLSTSLQPGQMDGEELGLNAYDFDFTVSKFNLWI